MRKLLIYMSLIFNIALVATLLRVRDDAKYAAEELIRFQNEKCVIKTIYVNDVPYDIRFDYEQIIDEDEK